MGLVKTRRLAAMQKQTTYDKATVVRQRAKFRTPPLVKNGGSRSSERLPQREGRFDTIWT